MTPRSAALAGPPALALALFAACGGSSPSPAAAPETAAAREAGEGEAVQGEAVQGEAVQGEAVQGEAETGGPAEPAASPPCEAPRVPRGASCAFPDDVPAQAGNLNVLGEPLEACSTEPLTGFRRTGRCETGPEDRGVHVVCAEVTDAFLRFSAARGNDLLTPAPRYRFPGLRPGDRWCLCASRWAEAVDAGVAPPVVLAATDDAALRHVPGAVLRAHAHACAARD